MPSNKKSLVERQLKNTLKKIIKEILKENTESPTQKDAAKVDFAAGLKAYETNLDLLIGQLNSIHEILHPMSKQVLDYVVNGKNRGNVGKENFSKLQDLSFFLSKINGALQNFKVPLGFRFENFEFYNNLLNKVDKNYESGGTFYQLVQRFKGQEEIFEPSYTKQIIEISNNIENIKNLKNLKLSNELLNQVGIDPSKITQLIDFDISLLVGYYNQIVMAIKQCLNALQRFADAALAAGDITKKFDIASVKTQPDFFRENKSLILRKMLRML